ncbi:MAG: TetR/AcrR family transcriptional regulator, partial [Acinetobacter sp.]
STTGDITTYLSQIIHFQIEQVQQQQMIWQQIFQLERQVSSQDAYQKHYELMLKLWNEILMPFIAEVKQRQRTALNLHRISYGFISQTLLVNSCFNSWHDLTQDILLATHTFIVKLNHTAISD